MLSGRNGFRNHQEIRRYLSFATIRCLTPLIETRVLLLLPIVDFLMYLDVDRCPAGPSVTSVPIKEYPQKGEGVSYSKSSVIEANNVYDVLCKFENK